MKVIFSKFNCQRLPCFQTLTKIVEFDDGSKKAIKKALTNDGKAHIATIYANYSRLINRYPHVKLVKPTLEDDKTISFPMATGTSFEKLLKQALDRNDKEKFFILLNKFVSYVDGFVSKRDVKFVPCDKFRQIFGEWTIDEPQDLIELANVDMIFSNLFIAEDGVISQIDYEWVFEFSIPKSLIISRAILIFCYQFNYLSIIVSIDEIFHNISLNKSFISRFVMNNQAWLGYVHSDNRYANNIQVLKEQVNIFHELTDIKTQLTNTKSELYKTQTELGKTQIELSNTQGYFTNSQLELSNTQTQLSNTQSQLSNIYVSYSWKITQPLRWLMKVFKRFHNV